MACKPARYRFTSEVTLTPSDPASCSFALEDVTIGIGFHWERKERQVFRGALRIIKRDAGLTVVNDVPLEEYVTSVISSEMSASCPIELLKAHAVISRSWLLFPKEQPSPGAPAEREPVRAKPQERAAGPEQGSHAHEILRWYGREAHPDFDVCADDHCQRYQGITKAFSSAAADAVTATTGEFLRYNGMICDARFSKCCGGITERYSTAWEDQEIRYLESVYDGPAQTRAHIPETWIRSDPPAHCNTRDSDLLSRILPGFDRETRDFYRWRVEYSPDELADLVKSRVGVDLGPIRDIEALARGPSGRIYRLKLSGERDYLFIGKELEIRRALSRTHLYSSAFVVDKESGHLVLRGAGWGHGVGLCQIGAAVMANEGRTYKEILQHYYRGTTVSA
ncbi:MAG: amidase [Acidobacteria bacterium]|nr:MAG: amidase [Acidobacteriota bacterium]